MTKTCRLTGVLAIAWAVIAPARAEAQAADPATSAPPADTSRLFFGPTGRMLAPGQGYVAFDAGPFMATVQVGVTSTFEMGGGTIFVPTGGAHPFWATPKVQVYDDGHTSVAAGVIHVFVPGEGRGGLAYTVGTVGSLNASTTIGGGVFYGDDSGDRHGPSISPVLLVGGERRFKPRVSFMTENYLGPQTAFISAGFRWRFRDWQLNTFGGVSIIFDEVVFPGGGVTFAYKFGKK